LYDGEALIGRTLLSPPPVRGDVTHFLVWSRRRVESRVLCRGAFNEGRCQVVRVYS
jgi:hypothetical protein